MCQPSNMSVLLCIQHKQFTIYSTQTKQQYGLSLRIFVHPNLPQVGFELGSLGPQVGLLPIEPPLIVQ